MLSHAQRTQIRAPNFLLRKRLRYLDWLKGTVRTGVNIQQRGLGCFPSSRLIIALLLNLRPTKTPEDIGRCNSWKSILRSVAQGFTRFRMVPIILLEWMWMNQAEWKSTTKDPPSCIYFQHLPRSMTVCPTQARVFFACSRHNRLKQKQGDGAQRFRPRNI